MIAWLVLMLASSPVSDLDKGVAALKNFDAPTAATLLERSRSAGPYSLEQQILLYEQLGIAQAYLGDTSAASASFATLLRLDPGHVLSYTLSPKATFLFERARTEAASQTPPQMDVTWPRGLRVGDPVPVTIENVSDPAQSFHTVELRTRPSGESAFRRKTLAAPAKGAYLTEPVEPWAYPARDEVVYLFMSVKDSSGNEVYRVGSAERPRELNLSYVEPTPWYKKPWIWVVAGSVVAAGTGTAVYLATHEPPARVGGTITAH